MGKASPGGADLSSRFVAGTFTSVTTGTAMQVDNTDFNASVYGTFVATVAFEKSFDGGTTFIAVSRDASGTAATFTAPASFLVNDPEQGVLYRFNCTAYTSGTASYRLSQ